MAVEFVRLSAGFEGKQSVRTTDREIVDGLPRRQVVTRWDGTHTFASQWVQPDALAESPDGAWLAIPPEEFAAQWSAALATQDSTQVWLVLSSGGLQSARDTGWTGLGAGQPGVLRAWLDRAAALAGQASADQTAGPDATDGPRFLAALHVCSAFVQTLPADQPWELDEQARAELDLFAVGPVVVVQQLG